MGSECRSITRCTANFVSLIVPLKDLPNVLIYYIGTRMVERLTCIFCEARHYPQAVSLFEIGGRYIPWISAKKTTVLEVLDAWAKSAPKQYTLDFMPNVGEPSNFDQAPNSEKAFQ